jgi:EmrB/QacA subfamily drug resistance transporter
MTSSTTARPGLRWDARTWGALIVLCGALFLDGLDVSMVGMALPSIRTDLHLSTSSLQWVVSGYVLGYGGLLLLGGRAADLLGRRRVFLIALAAFAVASLLGGVVSSGALLIATRFIKGVAAAFTAPAGLSIITTTFSEGPARNRALSIYTTCGASGFSMGLILGGLLTEVGWRWTFLLPVPIAVVAFIAGRLLITDDGRPARASRGTYDLAGAVTATGAMLLLVYAVVQAPTVGWTSVQTLLSAVGVVALLVAFVTVEQRTAHPLVRLAILRSGALSRANIGAMTVFGAYVGFQFVGTLYLQSMLHWSPLKTALAFLPAGALVVLGSPHVGRLADRVGTGRVLVAGALAFVIGYPLALRIDLVPSYPAVILPTILLLGVGFGLCFPALNIQATSGVADDEQGLASGLVNTSFQIGGAVVLAVVTAVVSSGGGHQSNTDLLASYHTAIAVVAGVAALGLVVALGGLVRRRRPAPETEAANEPVPIES